MRIVAKGGVRLLRRVLHRSFDEACVGIRTAPFAPSREAADLSSAGLLQVFLGHHAVVFHGDLRRVAQPRRHHVDRVLVHQFGLPTRPQVVERSGPRLQASPLDESHDLGAKAACSPAPRLQGLIPEASTDHVDRTFRCRLKGFPQDRLQLGEERPGSREKPRGVTA